MSAALGHDANALLGISITARNQRQSRQYERMANPALQATSEFFADEIYYKK